MPRRVSIVVSFDLPAGATREDALWYVDDAVSGWKGGLQPPRERSGESEGDPMFNLNPDSVVTSFRGKGAGVV